MWASGAPCFESLALLFQGKTPLENLLALEDTINALLKNV
jgi:hypothetical protein